MATSSRPLAVVTGASSGIGFELARQFADHGYDLIVAAEGDAIDRVRGLASDGGAVETVRVDLTTPDGVEQLNEHIVADGRPVAALALNAGVGEGGQFVSNGAQESSLDQELAIVDLNVRSVVHLAKLVLPQMVARHEGRVLLTSSVESTMVGTYQAVYGASKAFVQSFALALRNELKSSGVSVTTLMPGPVDTAFFEKAGMEDTRVGAGSKDDPADVARQGFEALMAGRERVVAASLSSKVMGRVGRVLPDSVKASLHTLIAEPRSALDR